MSDSMIIYQQEGSRQGGVNGKCLREAATNNF